MSLLIDPQLIAENFVYAIVNNSGWEKFLSQYQSLLNSARTTGLPSPYQDFSNDFIFEFFPKVISSFCKIYIVPSEEKSVLPFLQECISTIIWSFSVKKRHTLIVYLIKILDPSAILYQKGVLNQIKANSTLYNDVASFFLKKFGHVFLLKICTNESTMPSDVACIMEVIRLIAKSMGSNVVFPKIDQTNASFLIVLNNLILNKSFESYPLLELENIIQSILSISPSEEIISQSLGIIKNMINSGLEKPVRTSLKVLSYIIISTSIPLDQSMIKLFISLVTNNDRFTIMKPSIICLLQKKLISHNEINDIWDRCNYSDMYIQFCDIVPYIESVPAVIQIVSKPLRIEVVEQLATLPQYFEPITLLLWNQYSSTKNLESIISFFEKWSSKYTFKHLILPITSYLKKQHMFFGPLSIVLFNSVDSKFENGLELVSTLIEAFHYSKYEESLLVTDSIIGILKKTGVQLNTKLTQSLLDSIDDSNVKIYLLKSLVQPDQIPNIDNSCLLPLTEFIEYNGMSERGFAYTEYLYKYKERLIFPSSKFQRELYRSLEISLWKLVSLDPKFLLWKQSAHLLIMRSPIDLLPDHLCCLVDKAISNLKIETTPGCIGFIKYIIDYTSNFVDPSKIGYLRQKNIKKTINLRVSHIKKVMDISLNKNQSLLEYIPSISDYFGLKIGSFQLTSNNAAIDLNMPINYYLDNLKIVNIEFIDPLFDNLPVFDNSNHPISRLVIDENYSFLISLLESKYGKEIMEILFMLPRSNRFDYLGFYPKKQMTTLFQLMSIRSQLNEQSQELIERLLLEHNSSILFESKLVILKSIRSTNNIEFLSLIKTFFRESKHPSHNKLMNHVRRILSQATIDIDDDLCGCFFINDKKSMLGDYLNCPLLLNQNFAFIWSVFIKNKSPDYLRILSSIQIPQEFYPQIFDILMPMFYKFNEPTFIIFCEMASRWSSFPFIEIKEYLIKNLISNISPINSDYPYKLLHIMSEKMPDIFDSINTRLSSIINSDLKWNIDSSQHIFLTPSFAKFISGILVKSSTKRSLEFYLKVLSKSIDDFPFIEFTNKIISLLDVENSLLKILVNMLMESTEFIFLILSKSKESVRKAFIGLLEEIISRIDYDHPLIQNLVDLFPHQISMMLNNWRNGFDIFYVLSSYCHRSIDHAHFIQRSGFINDSISFIIKFIPQYFGIATNSAEYKEFLLSVDLTHLFYVFIAIGEIDNAITSNQFLSICLSSRFHSEALVRLLKSKISLSSVASIIEKCNSSPSEELLISLCKNSEFIPPINWFNSSFFSSSSSQTSIVALLMKSQNLKDIIFTSPSLVSGLAFSKYFKIQNAFYSLTNMFEKSDKCDLLVTNLSSITNLFSDHEDKYLFSLQQLSQSIKYSRHPLKHIKVLNGVLSSIPKNYQIQIDYIIYIIQSFSQLCMIKEALTEGLNENILGIINERVFALPMDHPEFESTVSLYLNMVSSVGAVLSIHPDIVFPDTIRSLFFGYLFLHKSQHPKILDSIFNVFESYGETESLTTRLLHCLSQELSKAHNPYMRSVYIALSFISNQYFLSSIIKITSRPETIKFLFSSINFLMPNDGISEDVLIKLRMISENSIHQLDTIVRESPNFVSRFLRIVVNTDYSYLSRESALQVVMICLPSTHTEFVRIYENRIVAEVITESSIDDYVSSLLLLFLKLWPTENQIPSIEAQTIIANEFVYSMLSAKSLDDRKAILVSLSEVFSYTNIEKIQKFIEIIDRSEIIPVIWNLSINCKLLLSGLMDLSALIVLNTLNMKQVKAIGAICMIKQGSNEIFDKMIGIIRAKYGEGLLSV